MNEPASAASAVGRPRLDNGFIAGPVYDSVFFIFAPAIALFLGAGIHYTGAERIPLAFPGYTGTLTHAFLGAFIMAHLFLVGLRSHLNPSIFALYPFRFTVVPIALLLGMLASPWILVSVSVLATGWDVYHSGLQTFGFARIYDRRRGNDPHEGRWLDLLLNHVLYAGPILGGAVLMAHVNDFNEFSKVGAAFFTSIPPWVEARHQTLARLVLAGGGLFLAIYVIGYWRLARRGYRISTQKVVLLTVTGLTSLVAWGFNSFGQAFFIMNVFHALQYFALVWWSERKALLARLNLERRRWGSVIAFGAMIAATFGYGLWAELYDSQKQNQAITAVTLVVSIMHFWYDGFIWSVRKGQV